MTRLEKEELAVLVVASDMSNIHNANIEMETWAQVKSLTDEELDEWLEENSECCEYHAKKEGLKWATRC